MWLLTLIPPKWWAVIIGLVLACLFLIGATSFFFFSALQDDQNESELVSEEGGHDGIAQVSAELEELRPIFEKYAEEHDMEDHIDVLMAMAMQESGGRLEDVMQSSESLGLPVNSLNQEESIEQGVKYFKEVLGQANGDVKLALQSYNFGSGFINYANEHNGGAYSKDIAIDFSRMMYNKLSHTGAFSCIRPESESTGACYGDIGYVDAIFSYLSTHNMGGGTGDGDMVFPVDGEVRKTSDFGYRTDPFDEEQIVYHKGTDYACTEHITPILSIADGQVTNVEVQSGYGNIVIIDHGDYYSAYAHLSSFDVSPGDSVSAGDKVATCGNTGTSTGAHLHLEVRQSQYGDFVDPVEFMGIAS
ncbi:lysozyme family protein [Shouchella miscanthi]|uniref:lysozyme family protein n=1 Tax=Shouchella miscanthi TaxID=2598861 RepID=UPI0011A8496B|nr:lysozyme family protein [Shouchella miscanthi]